MLYKKTVQLILESIGRPEEVEYYLKRFKSKTNYFCLIVPDYQTLNENFQHFMISLEILSKLELFPIILICGPKWEDYQKYFEKQIFEIVVINDLKTKENYLIDFIKKNDKKILVVFSNSFLVDFVSFFHNQLPDRIHFVRNEGFIRDINKNQLYILDALEINQSNTNKKVELKVPEKLKLIYEEDVGIYILASMIYNSYDYLHISITSPFMLLKELFTIKGSGTLIRRPSKILYYTKEQVSENLLKKMKNIIEECFQKKVKEQALEKFTDAFLDSEEQSLVLLEKQDFGYYLSKFAVSIEARGKGIAQDLWNELQNRNYSLFWKTNQKNSIKKWYEKICDGFYKWDPYIIFWKNISYEKIPKIIEFIKERGSDFYEDN